MKTEDTLKKLAELLWSIGDTLDEMDHTDKQLWDRIKRIGYEITELAQTLPESGQAAKVRDKILSENYLYLGWGRCVDEIEKITGSTRPRFSELIPIKSKKEAED